MKQLMLLHGALGAGEQLQELAKELSKTFDVAICEFEGHGKSSSLKPFSIELFVENTLTKLNDLGWKNPHVFGYSMGGYVALKLESMAPNTFVSIGTLGTKFDWNPTSALRESSFLNPEVMQQKIPKYAQYLEQLHGEKWVSVVQKTAAMMLEMGSKPPLTATDLEKIPSKVVCLRGANDAMVNVEETMWATNLLPSAEYMEIPNWQHPIDRIPTEDLLQQLQIIFKG